MTKKEKKISKKRKHNNWKERKKERKRNNW